MMRQVGKEGECDPMNERQDPPFTILKGLFCRV